MSRPARAHIDLQALARNYQRLRKLHGRKALAVLKADAYGHGARDCARRLDGEADGFAVAFAEEAIPLREAGVRAPILVLEGAFSVQETQALHTHGLWTVVHHAEQLRMLELARLAPGSIDVWLKVDSGMHRAGFAPQEAHAAHARLRACAAVRNIVLMTHFARADEPALQATAQQISDFDRATQGLAGERSLCNSAGLLAWPEARRDWGRCGIALYGADPLTEHARGLEPVMQLESEIFAVRDLAAGDAVGYGGTFVAERPMRIGLVAMGYADGYPRGASNGAPVRVAGSPSTVVGRVSMDMLTIDLTDLPACGVGSTVELWGAAVDINAVAAHAGTIAYELLCNVKRVRKTYSPL
jgi:alanine racemase